MAFIELLNESKLCGKSGPLLNHRICAFEEHPHYQINHSWYSPFGTFDCDPLHSIWVTYMGETIAPNYLGVPSKNPDGIKIPVLDFWKGCRLPESCNLEEILETAIELGQ